MDRERRSNRICCINVYYMHHSLPLPSPPLLEAADMGARHVGVKVLGEEIIHDAQFIHGREAFERLTIKGIGDFKCGTQDQLQSLSLALISKTTQNGP